ncbi:MAG TPA: hypothetical protein VLJ60_03285, partial [bacterium]|nr:hypothetical protein [bacterium]
MKNIFVSWVGFNDLDSISGKSQSSGPVRAFLDSELSLSIDEFHLIYNSARKDETLKFIKFLDRKYPFRIITHDAGEIDPSNFREIYTAVKRVIDSVVNGNPSAKLNWHFHTSPGTPQMASVWLLLGASEYNAELYQSYMN